MKPGGLGPVLSCLCAIRGWQDASAGGGVAAGLEPGDPVLAGQGVEVADQADYRDDSETHRHDRCQRRLVHGCGGDVCAC